MKRPLKILLMKVPEIDYEEKKISYTESLSLGAPPIPLGIASLSAYLKKTTPHEVLLSDIFLEGFDAYSGTHDREVFFNIIENRIRETMPDVVGISALMIINYKWVHHVANVAKRIKPDIKVIVGGGYASILPDRVLDDGNVDFIVIGEGEETLLNILETGFDAEKLAGAPGVGFRDGSGRKAINRRTGIIADVDSLPFYDWEGIGLRNYMKRHKEGYVSYITSRGCPFKCTFCSTHLLWGRKFRPLSAKRVLEEIDYLVKNYNIRFIEFRDDNLTLDKARILEILSGFIERGYKLTWNNPNAVAIVTLDEQVIRTMKESGCDTLIIAVESGSERVLKEVIHKPVTRQKAKEVCRIGKDVGLKVQTAFIIGFPGETKKAIDETRNFAIELQCDWNQFSIATPFPGTEMYEICKEKNYFVKAESDLERYRYGFANISTDEFDDRWLKEKTYDINIEVNFLRNHNFEDDPEYAIILFKDILSRYPKHLVGIFCLAHACRKAGKMKEADDTVKRANYLIENDPELYETYKKYIDPENPVFEGFSGLARRKVN